MSDDLLLIHLARRASPAFLEMAEGARLEPELGEGLRCVHLPRGATLSAPARWLCRYVLPVQARRATGRHRDFEPGDVLRWAAQRLGAGPVEAFTLRRAGRKLVRALERERGPLTGRRDATRARVVLAIGDREILAGRVTPREAGSLEPGNLWPRRALREANGPSRAAVKWRESAALLELLGAPPPSGGRWLELGASPGGITSELLEQGAEVVAIDRAPHRLSHPRLTFLRGDAREVEPSAGSFDGLVCDINGAPAHALEAVLAHAPRLAPGAPIIYTLKLPAWSDLPALAQRTAEALAEAGWETLALRHLVSHRQEVVVVAQDARSPS